MRPSPLLSTPSVQISVPLLRQRSEVAQSGSKQFTKPSRSSSAKVSQISASPVQPGRPTQKGSAQSTRPSRLLSIRSSQFSTPSQPRAPAQLSSVQSTKPSRSLSRRSSQISGRSQASGMPLPLLSARSSPAAQMSSGAQMPSLSASSQPREQPSAGTHTCGVEGETSPASGTAWQTKPSAQAPSASQGARQKAGRLSCTQTEVGALHSVEMVHRAHSDPGVSVQSASQPSPPTPLPSSQASPVSQRPLPQPGEGIVVSPLPSALEEPSLTEPSPEPSSPVSFPPVLNSIAVGVVPQATSSAKTERRPPARRRVARTTEAGFNMAGLQSASGTRDRPPLPVSRSGASSAGKTGAAT